MRKLVFISLLFSLISMHLQAQTKFEGYWAGKLKTDGGDEILIVLKITNGVAKRYSYDKDKEKLVPFNPLKETTISQRNNLCFTWMNQGGVWTETQTYLLSYLDDETLSIVWVRQVNNIKDDADENDRWSVKAEGKLEHYTKEELDDLL